MNEREKLLRESSPEEAASIAQSVISPLLAKGWNSYEIAVVMQELPSFKKNLAIRLGATNTAGRVRISALLTDVCQVLLEFEKQTLSIMAKKDGEK
jgi:hypothetical protein